MNPDALKALDRTLLFCEGLVLTSGSVTREAIASALMSQTVALVVDEANLSRPSCQSAVLALARLVLGYGASLRLVFPEVSIVGEQPPLRGGHFRTALVDLAEDVVPGTRATTDSATKPTDLVFVFGDTAWSGRAANSWRLTAEGWSGQTSSVDERGTGFADDFPLGALAAAAIASVEPFKAAMRTFGTAVLRGPDQMAAVPHARVELAPSNKPIGSVDLGRVDCISGGAITNSLLFSLLRIPRVSGQVRVIESDTADISNLNRYVLLRRSAIPRPKVDVFSEYSTEQLKIFGERALLNPETIRSLRPLADRVVVGADRVPARWDAQREWPAWVCVGATDDWMAQVTEHTTESACAGCAYPEAIPNPPLEIATVSFVSFWAGLVAAARLVSHVTGNPYPANQQSFTLLGPARLDGPAVIWTPISRNSACPVGCASLSVH